MIVHYSPRLRAGGPCLRAGHAGVVTKATRFVSPHAGVVKDLPAGVCQSNLHRAKQDGLADHHHGGVQCDHSIAN